jgi:hypothetical protein
LFFIGFEIDPLASPTHQSLNPFIIQTSSLFAYVVRLNDAIEDGGKRLERKRKKKKKGKEKGRKEEMEEAGK